MAKLNKKTKWALWLITLFIVMIGIGIYWHHRIMYPQTDDAYVQAHVIDIAPQVSGPVSHVYAHNNEIVQEDQPLFDIDPTPFQIAMHRAQANLAQAKQKMQAEKQAVVTARTLITQRQSELDFAKKEARRAFYLVHEGQMTKEAGDSAANKLHVAQAALQSAKSQLKQAQAKLGSAGPKNADIRAAEAALAQAQLNLKHTHIKAPAEGKIVNLDLRPGTYVNTSEKLFNIVQMHEWWVDANYKETQMERMKSGQSAKITVDMYPNVTLKGKIQSISAGSGAAFSLLPPENATGNWVKVTQRFPVKILITQLPKQVALRMGASANVVVDTTQ